MRQLIIRSPALLVLHPDIHLQVNGAQTGAETRPAEDQPPVIHLNGVQWVIGRDRSCDICVRSDRYDVSRRHLTIRQQGEQFVLEDHSSFGTFVNGQPVRMPWLLVLGDVFGLATTPEMLRFVDVSDDQALPVLTPRERHVLKLLADGKADKEIAVEMQISAATVNSHLKRIYEKLEAHTRLEAVNTARRYRLV